MRLRSKPRPRRQHRTKLSVQTFYESEDEFFFKTPPLLVHMIRESCNFKKERLS